MLYHVLSYVAYLQIAGGFKVIQFTGNLLKTQKSKAAELAVNLPLTCASNVLKEANPKMITVLIDARKTCGMVTDL